MLIFAVIPFTLLVIRPTNNLLLDPRRGRRSDETLRLLKVWGRLHAVRGALSVAASVLFVWAATR
jgi:Anthrone oxygenase